MYSVLPFGVGSAYQVSLIETFFERNFVWFSFFICSRVEYKFNYQTCIKLFVICLLFVICFITEVISKPRLFPIKFKFNIPSATL